MDMTVLQADRRADSGSRRARRLRRGGRVPAVLYGHGEDVAPLSIEEEALRAVVESESHAVDLEVDGQALRAIIKEVQFDTWGREILHVDFVRVLKGERVVVSVNLLFHGAPKEVETGAMLEHPVTSIDAECEADQIPGHIRVEVGGMVIGDMIYIGDIALPEGLVCKSEPRGVAAVLHAPQAEEEEVEEEEVAASAEPELIGREEKEDSEEAT